MSHTETREYYDILIQSEAGDHRLFDSIPSDPPQVRPFVMMSPEEWEATMQLLDTLPQRNKNRKILEGEMRQIREEREQDLRQLEKMRREMERETAAALECRPKGRKSRRKR